jgi:hypothetical protein
MAARKVPRPIRPLALKRNSVQSILGGFKVTPANSSKTATSGDADGGPCVRRAAAALQIGGCAFT